MDSIVILWIAFALIVALIASQFGRSFLLLLLIGIFATPIGPVVVVIVDQLKGHYKKCQNCAGSIMNDARKCKHCKLNFDDPNQNKDDAHTSALWLRRPVVYTILTALVLAVLANEFLPSIVISSRQQQAAEIPNSIGDEGLIASLAEKIVQADALGFVQLVAKLPMDKKKAILSKSLCSSCTPATLLEMTAVNGLRDLVVQLPAYLITLTDRARLIEISTELGHTDYALSMALKGFDSSQLDLERLVKLAYSQENIELAETLLRYAQNYGTEPIQIDSNVVDESGWTPLMYAAYENRYSEFVNLVNQGADLNFVDDDGNSALIVAASIGNVEIVNWAIKKGADFFIRNNQNLSVGDVAKYAKHREIATSLENQQTAAIKAVQEGLYNLFYEPGPSDGVFGSKTEEAIKRYQEKKGLPVDGKLSMALYQELDGAYLSGPWGALAYNWDGAFSTRVRHRTRREAADKALEFCIQKGYQCTAATIGGKNCISFARSTNGAGSVRVGDSKREAERHSIEACNERSDDKCAVRASICADGRS